MTNEEKLSLIRKILNLRFKFFNKDMDTYSKLEIKEIEGKFYNEYSKNILNKMPNKFYKYRSCTETAIENFKNDKSWFSHPIDFDDSIDCVVNFDLEGELEEFRENPNKFIKELMPTYFKWLLNNFGINVNLDYADDIISWYDDGNFNKEKVFKYLSRKMEYKKSKKLLNKLEEFNSKINNPIVFEAAEGYLNSFKNTNSKLKTTLLILSLAEENDNELMWGCYSDSSKGFCIEYTLNTNSLIGQQMLSNIYPVYYGESIQTKLIKILFDSVFLKDDKKSINGIPIKEYINMYQSTLTKKKSWEPQKEWRIVLDHDFGGNLQDFPFATSLILGERIDSEFKRKLIAIGENKNIDIYERKLNLTGNKINLVKIFTKK